MSKNSNNHSSPTRPIMRYFGGKWNIAEWIVSHFPPHCAYCEPYGGVASVLLQKARVKDEIYNDLDGEIVNVFRVCRDPKLSHKLVHLCELTPYAADEYQLAFQPTSDPVEKARRTIFKASAGFSSNTSTRKHKTSLRDRRPPTSGFRIGKGNYQPAAKDWEKYPTALRQIIERLRGVLILNKAASEIIAKYDSPEMLFYVDPPYTHTTRTSGDDYRHEMTDEDHLQLAEQLHAIAGKAVVSGYRNDLYDTLYRDWQRHDLQTKGQSNKGTKKNIESIWLSPNIKAIQERIF